MTPTPTHTLRAMARACQVLGLAAALWAPLATWAAPAEAGGDAVPEATGTVGLHLYSQHTQPGFEDVTPGLYYRWASGWQAGVLRNSYQKTSVYGAYTLPLDADNRLGVLLGAITGYEEASGHKVVPLLAPHVGVELTPGLWARLAWFVTPGAQDAQALHLSLERRLGPAPERRTAAADAGTDATLRPLLALGMSWGGERLLVAELDGVQTHHLPAGAGVLLQGGAEWRLSPQAAVQATVGVHVKDASVADGLGVRWLRYPVQVLGLYQPHPQWRVGLGVSHALRPSLSSHSRGGDTRLGLAASTSLLAQGEYLLTPQLGLALRLERQRWRIEDGAGTAGPSRDGRSVGLLMNVYF